MLLFGDDRVGFNPGFLANGRIWLDGNDTNGTYGLIPVANNTAIGTWVNKFNLDNFVQSTGGNQPLFNTAIQNGRGGVTFDGTNDTFSYPAALLNIANGDNTAFWVFKKTLDNATTNRLVALLNAGVLCYVINAGLATTSVPYHNFTSDTNYVSAVANILNYNIVVTRLNVTLQGIAVNNGAENAAVNGAPTGTITAGNLFSQGGAIPLPGTLLEYIHYGANLSAGERYQVVKYLSQKWGIAIT